MKLLEPIANIIRGACMAAADSVPGVSGGTIAFILGFYEKFVSSINDFLLGPWDAKKKHFPSLLRLESDGQAAF
jgi:Predicted membrane protein